MEIKQQTASIPIHELERSLLGMYVTNNRKEGVTSTVRGRQMEGLPNYDNVYGKHFGKIIK